MSYTGAINSVSGELGLTPQEVDNIYKAFWQYIRESIQELSLKDDLSEEEFNSLRTNFNIPSIGKLCLPYSRYVGVKKKFDIVQKIKKKNEEIN